MPLNDGWNAIVVSASILYPGVQEIVHLRWRGSGGLVG